MNTINRADALANLATLYEVDPDSWNPGGRRVLEYLECPDAISPYIEVIGFAGVTGPGGEVECPAYFELRVGFDDPWECVDTAERDYDLDFEFGGNLVGVVDLDRWTVLQRDLSGWSFYDLPD
jgi:hypothetical protein